MTIRSGGPFDDDVTDTTTVAVSKAPSPLLRIGLSAALGVIGLWIVIGAFFSTGEAEPEMATPTTSTRQQDPAAQSQRDDDATMEAGDDSAPISVRPELVAALETLRKSPGIGLTLCNAQSKHFTETPEQIERARRYAKCLDDFGIPFRLPTAAIHPAYAIPQDVEPSVILRCGDSLTGPDVSTAAYELFERCAREAEVLFGITQLTS